MLVVNGHFILDYIWQNIIGAPKIQNKFWWNGKMFIKDTYKRSNREKSNVAIAILKNQ